MINCALIAHRKTLLAIARPKFVVLNVLSFSEFCVAPSFRWAEFLKSQPVFKPTTSLPMCSRVLMANRIICSNQEES
jgi:hypothetical protein